jgi:hypothetical protein
MRVRRDDLIGAVGCVLVAVRPVLPSLAPFVLLRGDFMLALRVSNLVSFGMLFAAGRGYGYYSPIYHQKRISLCDTSLEVALSS